MYGEPRKRLHCEVNVKARPFMRAYHGPAGGEARLQSTTHHIINAPSQFCNPSTLKFLQFYPNQLIISSPKPEIISKFKFILGLTDTRSCADFEGHLVYWRIVPQSEPLYCKRPFLPTYPGDTYKDDHSYSMHV